MQRKLIVFTSRRRNAEQNLHIKKATDPWKMWQSTNIFGIIVTMEIAFTKKLRAD
jgi:hypothetical protein